MNINITRTAVGVYAGMQIFVLGALLSETILLYPNVFRDIPASFDDTLAFLQVTDPGAVFPPLGALTMVVGFIALGLTWRAHGTRSWLVVSLIAFILGNAVMSILFAWPRNEIMFDQGVTMHSIAYLEQVVGEFMLVHAVRIVASALASVSATIGFLKIYRSQYSQQPMQQRSQPSERGWR